MHSLVLPWALLAAALLGGEPRSNVRFEVVVEGASGAAETAGALSVRSVEDATAEPLRLDLGGRLEVSLPPGSIWELRVTAPGYWSPPEVLTVPPAGQGLLQRLFLWPSTTLSGSFWVQEGRQPPRELEVGLRSSQGTPGRALAGTARCPVDAKTGAWTCSLPVANLDLILRPGEFVPLYRWQQRVPPEGLDLGRVLLRPGASVSGLVRVEDGVVDPAACEVRLSPWQAHGSGGVDVEVVTRIRSMFTKAHVSEKGFFQLVGIAPGTYVLEVEQPPLPPARVFPVEVWPDLESRLEDPVVLYPGVELGLTVVPSVDWLGRPWRVSLYRASATGGGFPADPVFSGPATKTGSLRLFGQAPGRYYVQVDDALGNGFLTTPDILVGKEGLERQLDLEVVLVEGQVLYRDAALSAQLWFGGRHNTVSVELASDAEGRFAGVLPLAGRWRVELSAPSPALELRISADVEPDEDGVAWVEIVVPDTEVFGRVVDDRSGARVEGAQVHLLGAGGPLMAYSDREGEFVLHGAPEERAVIHASRALNGRPRSSEQRVVVPQDGRATGPLELRLKAFVTLSGTVVSPRGPVVGARVSLGPMDPRFGNRASVARTDTAGAFATEVPEAPRYLAMVSPPGYPLTLFELASPAGRPITLSVDGQGGQLEIVVGMEPAAYRDEGYSLRVWQNGLPLSLSSLYHWAAGHGVVFETERQLRAPRLASGDYRVCIGPGGLTQGAAETQAWRDEKAVCRSGFLNEGGTLVLELPPVDAGEEPRPPTRDFKNLR